MNDRVAAYKAIVIIFSFISVIKAYININSFVGGISMPKPMFLSLRSDSNFNIVKRYKIGSIQLRTFSGVQLNFLFYFMPCTNFWNVESGRILMTHYP